MEKSEGLEHLQPLDFFAGLGRQILRDVSLNCTQVMIPAGHVLFRQGEESDSLYIVSTGRLDVSVEFENKPAATISELGPGEFVGEMGLLTGEPRSATVTSLRDSLLFRLSKERFEVLLKLHPELSRRIACNLSRRIQHANVRHTSRVPSVKTFAVIPAGEVAPTADFLEKITHALSEIGPTRRITKAAVEEGIGSSDPSDSRVVHWLNEQESKYAFLIYEADLWPSAWTSRCIRQADRILAVGRFEAKRDLNEIEREIHFTGRESPGVGKSHPRIDLILLHREGGNRPHGTPEWLKLRSSDKHHHIHSENPKDFHRLARVLTGRAVGLVLGGGGSRGFAHIGALRAIEEAGIPIETIGGTSQGALIGAQYAMGLTPHEMIEVNRALFRDFRPFKGDRTIPIHSFVTGKTSNRGLQNLFGKLHISDLKIPFFSIAANLSMATLIVDRHHPVWKAVRCSMSLPGLMPPVIEGGNLIVDGGVLNNLPVDVMRESCDGNVIAVDVSPPVDMLVDSEDRDHLRFMDFARCRLSGRKTIPNLIEIINRTAFLSSIHHREEMARHADLLIHPQMAGYGLLDWHLLEKLVEIGYDTTRARLKEWTGSAQLSTDASWREQLPAGVEAATR
jgi:predicted acylesterase/phospholipase RssA/CRP-like cAMP-binding protein